MIEIYGRIVDPILAAVKSESSAIIAKLHRESARSADPLSDMGGSSAYVKELTEKLAFVKGEIISRLLIEDVAREWFVTPSLLMYRLEKRIFSAQATGYRKARA
jgi:conserved oligomeric Golgi complex subunit 5